MVQAKSKKGAPWTIISLGGSLFFPDQIDIEFIRSFKMLIEKHVKAGERFLIVAGGGKVCRRYQQAGRDLGAATQHESDWIGIHVTRLNAHFLRIIFGDLAHDEVITDPSAVKKASRPIVFGAGWEPGCSTDQDAVLAAREVGAKRLINLSNTSYVYDKDPKTNPDARALKKLAWSEYRALIPAEFSPGLNTPFDPVAAREAQKDRLEVVIINGAKLHNLESYLAGKAFEGTVISG